jgi:hypothetical protein
MPIASRVAPEQLHGCLGRQRIGRSLSSIARVPTSRARTSACPAIRSPQWLPADARSVAETPARPQRPEREMRSSGLPVFGDEGS